MTTPDRPEQPTDPLQLGSLVDEGLIRQLAGELYADAPPPDPASAVPKSDVLRNPELAHEAHGTGARPGAAPAPEGAVEPTSAAAQAAAPPGEVPGTEAIAPLAQPPGTGQVEGVPGVPPPSGAQPPTATPALPDAPPSYYFLPTAGAETGTAAPALDVAALSGLAAPSLVPGLTDPPLGMDTGMPKLTSPNEPPGPSVLDASPPGTGSSSVATPGADAPMPLSVPFQLPTDPEGIGALLAVPPAAPPGGPPAASPTPAAGVEAPGMPATAEAPTTEPLPEGATHVPSMPVPTGAPMPAPELASFASPSAPPTSAAAAPAVPGVEVPVAPYASPAEPTVAGGLGTGEGFDAQAIRAEFPVLQQTIHGKPLIWMDNAATTQKPQYVIDAMSRFYERDYSNIHRGAHTLAARATDAYENAREKVRRFLGASSADEIIFVRGTTEAVNLVAKSWGRRYIGGGDEILLTQLEHHANIVPWQMLAQETGARIVVAPISDSGDVIMEEYARLLGPKTKLVAFAHVSNALGTVLPAAEMIAAAHRHGVPVLVDGAQSVPHTRVDVQALGADFYVFSGHKVYAPSGVGALYATPAMQEAMPPWQGGGNMIHTVTFEETTYAPPPAKFEAGTPTIGDAVGLGAAIDWVDRIGIDNISRHEHTLTDYAMEGLATVPGIRLIGTSPTKVSVLSFVLEGAREEDVGRYLDSEGIAVRAGHHCAMPTMQRYGVAGTVRPSLAVYNTREDVDRLVEALKRYRYA